jgi:hypothetical protein
MSEITVVFRKLLAISDDPKNILIETNVQIAKYNLSIVNNKLPIYNLSSVLAISLLRVADRPASAKYIIVSITV